jgi:hypothetical protein
MKKECSPTLLIVRKETAKLVRRDLEQLAQQPEQLALWLERNYPFWVNYLIETPSENSDDPFFQKARETARQWMETKTAIARNHSPQALRAKSVADAVFEAVSLLFPRRIRDEELGDGAEGIHRLMCLGRPAWQIYVKLASTIFWIMINALREVTSAGFGKLRLK